MNHWLKALCSKGWQSYALCALWKTKLQHWLPSAKMFMILAITADSEGRESEIEEAASGGDWGSDSTGTWFSTSHCLWRHSSQGTAIANILSGETDAKHIKYLGHDSSTTLQGWKVHKLKSIAGVLVLKIKLAVEGQGGDKDVLGGGNLGIPVVCFIHSALSVQVHLLLHFWVVQNVQFDVSVKIPKEALSLSFNKYS